MAIAIVIICRVTVGLLVGWEEMGLLVGMMMMTNDE